MRSPTEVRFEDRQRVVSLFAEAIAGRFVHVSPLEPVAMASTSRPLPGAFPLTGFRHPTGDLQADAPVVMVRASIDDFANRDHNAGAYRVAVLRQIENFESGMGTFDLDGAALVPGLTEAAIDARKLPPPYRPTLTCDLDRFLASVPFGTLIAQLLPILEAIRIDATVSTRYPGSQSDLTRTRQLERNAFDIELSLADPFPVLSVMDLAVRACQHMACDETLTGVIETRGSSPSQPSNRVSQLSSQLTELTRQLTGVIRPLAVQGATVYDSAVAAIRIVVLAEELTVSSQRFELADNDDVPDKTEPDPGSLPIGGGAQDVDRIDAAELSADDMTGTRADFDNDLLDDAPDGRGYGTSPNTIIETSAPSLTESGSKREPALLVTGIEQPEVPDRSASLRTPPARPTNDQRTYFYREWDYLAGAYLPSWCRLQERRLKGTNFTFIHDVRRQHSALSQQIRRRFIAVKPEAWHRVHRTPDGDEISLESLVETVVDRRSGHATDEHLYIRRERAVRDVAAAFLLDMSRSTDSPVPDPNATSVSTTSSVEPEESDPYRGSYFDLDEFEGDRVPTRRVIDVAKEALALMCDALHTLGDSHAIYGFSGSGRHNVEFHVAKEFTDATSPRTWAAVGAMEPIRYTRMGPAIRHATNKLVGQPERTRVLVVLTDGYPQDEGYGPDRNDRNYGIHDTAKALQEADAAGVSTFCITIDPAGHDYLRRMCAEDRYLVIDDIHSLAIELEKVYRTLTGRSAAGID